MRIIALFLLSLSLLMPVGSFGTTTTSHKTAASSQGNISDSQIQQTIQTKLAKSKIGKDGFRFHVSHGIVTWEGSTNVVQHKGSATRMAKAAGATKVVNNIQVSAAAKAKAAQGLRKAAVSEN